MTIETTGNGTNQRKRIWCMSSDLVEGSGTWTFDDETVAVGLGTGSEILVIDTGKLLLWDAAGQEAYEWGGGGA